MARIEDTAGNVTYTIPNCDCGLTGGCEKCQPIYIPNQPRITYKPSPRFDPNVFYKPIRKRISNIKAIREKSHRELGDAWRYLANH